jgi:hypothetical protein
MARHERRYSRQQQMEHYPDVLRKKPLAGSTLLARWRLSPSQHRNDAPRC